MSDSTARSLAYLSGQQCAPQWRGFGMALSGVLQDELGDADGAALMVVIGRRMAADIQVGPADTIGELESALNAHWRAVQWGWVQLSESGQSLDIDHYCAPLTAAFGEGGAVYGGALLEGVYTALLERQGLGDDLSVRHVGTELGAGDIFRLRVALPSVLEAAADKLAG